MRAAEWSLFQQTVPLFTSYLTILRDRHPLLLLGDDKLSQSLRDALYSIVNSKHGAFRNQDVPEAPSLDIRMDQAIKTLVACARYRQTGSAKALAFGRPTSSTSTVLVRTYLRGTDQAVERHNTLDNYRPVAPNTMSDPEMRGLVDKAYQHATRRRSKTSKDTRIAYVWDFIERFLAHALPGITLDHRFLANELNIRLRQAQTPESTRIAVRIIATMLRRAVRHPR